MNWYRSMVPRACCFIDADLKSTLEGWEALVYSSETARKRELAVEDLERLWTNGNTDYCILPCLSVRSGLDLFLSVKSFPQDSEIILSAINIPTIVHIIHHHGLKIRSCDIDVDTMTPSVEHLKTLMNHRTVAVFVAHLYGRRCNMNPIIHVCKSHSVPILEDCAEAFSGLNFIGHPESDLVFFSFGAIKPATAFGGGIVKIKEKKLYERMRHLHDGYPIQPHSQYAKKLAKYAFLTICFNNSFMFKYITGLFRLFGLDHRNLFVSFLRGFPTDLMNRIRQRPSVCLMNNLTFRLLSFTELDHKLAQDKGDYVTDRLPQEVRSIGTKTLHVGYWLFPILVEHPELVTIELNQLGVDASLSTTQLKLVNDDVICELDDVKSDEDGISPTPQASFLMKQVVYLPVHKIATYAELDRIIVALNDTVRRLGCRRLKLPFER